MSRLVVIPCGGRKASEPVPAGLLYTGSYHRVCRRAADRLGGHIVILSARHGFLELDTVVAPYDLRMGQGGSVTVEALREQAARRDLGGDEVIVLAGRAYADRVTAVWPHAIRPLDGARGMGHQMAILNTITRTGRLP